VVPQALYRIQLRGIGGLEQRDDVVPLFRHLARAPGGPVHDHDYPVVQEGAGDAFLEHAHALPVRIRQDQGVGPSGPRAYRGIGIGVLANDLVAHRRPLTLGHPARAEDVYPPEAGLVLEKQPYRPLVFLVREL